MTVPFPYTFECPTHGINPGTVLDGDIQRTGKAGKPVCEQCGQACKPVQVMSTAMRLHRELERDVQYVMATHRSQEPAAPLSVDPKAIAQAHELTQLRQAIHTLQTAYAATLKHR